MPASSSKSPRCARSPRMSPRGVKNKMSKGQKSYMTRSIKQINTLLWRNPEEVPLLLDRLEKADNETAQDDRMWHGTMSRLSAVPKPWLAAKLQRYQPLLTTAKLELMDTNPKNDTIRKTSQFCTGIDFSSWKMPRGALVKKILSMLMDARFEAYGRRLSEHFVEMISDTGEVDWSDAGIHGMVAIGSDVPPKVCNAVTKLAEKDPRMLPGGIHVMEDEKIIQNWSDGAASLSSFSLVFSEHTCCWKDHALVLSSQFAVFDAECAALHEKYGLQPPSPARGVGSGALASCMSKGASTASTTVPTELSQSTIGKRATTRASAKARQPKAAPITASLIDVNKL